MVGLAAAERIVVLEREIRHAIECNRGGAFEICAQVLLMGSALAANLSEAERATLGRRLAVKSAAVSRSIIRTTVAERGRIEARTRRDAQAPR